MPSSSGKGDEETAERRRTEVATVAMDGGIVSRWSAGPYLAGDGNRADGDLNPRGSQGGGLRLLVVVNKTLPAVHLGSHGPLPCLGH
jgi:hypothetical protein